MRKLIIGIALIIFSIIPSYGTIDNSVSCDHVGVIVDAFEPSCTISGRTEALYCVECKTFLEGGISIPAKGHQMAELPERAPTCSEDGVTSGTRCAICGYESVRQEIIPATHQGDVHTTSTKATTKKNGAISKECKTCGGVISKETIHKVETIKLSTKIYSYDGGRKSPTVTVFDGEGNTIKPNSYSIVNKTDRRSVGTHRYEIRFKGRYKGTKTVSFVIEPRKTAFKFAVKRKHSITLNWRKVPEQASGYQIQFSTKKSFSKKTTKVIQIKSKSTTAKTMKNLKSKKFYYAKIRSYKTVKGKNYYSPWSKVVKVKTL